jgi:FlaA1/EpsC-like NDP-sugar epimerase/lipopolysaccharide/colanic/teichoic acid biosynthesis glycosyltransferase
MVKRGFDLTVSGISLLVLGPFFLVLALLIRRDSAGPVFYRGERVGKNGKRFRIYKFRTMVADAERLGPGITPQNDPRVTRFGRRLRRSKLDELPQLINVVRGEMSLVGPRPEIAEMVDRYSPLFRRLLALRPGITSPASLAYRNEEKLIGTDPSRYADVILPEKLAFDIRYLLKHSIWTDLWIIVQTVAVIFALDSLPFRWLARSVRRHIPWLLLDAPVIVVAFYAALFLRLLDFPASQLSGYMRALTKSMLPLLALYLLMNSLWGVHRRVWRFATAADVRPIFAATLSATAIVLAADLYTGTFGPRLLPLGVILLGGFFSACGMVFIRYRSRLLRGLSPGNRSEGGGTRAIIFGAGDAGQHLALRLLTNQAGEEYDLVGFADDDPRRRGQRIHGLPVLGGRHELGQIVQRWRIDLIIIAFHAVRGEDVRDILTAAQTTPAQIRIIPNLFEVVRSASTVPLLREVRVEDLLGRQAVQLQRDACEGVLRGKIVLVTGGCGSVGSELCRQVAAFGPKHLVVLDNNETGLYDLDIALRATFRDLSFSITIGDVADRGRMDAIFKEVKPDIIFHAAAYKHVPLMEQFPQEAVKVNVGGTAVALEMARRHGAQHFVLVSTDKAVEPHSVMGATKRIAEMLVVGSNGNGAEKSMTRCTAVRFGNVLGSRGSVVPTFARQIDLGGPVTVTHPEMTRYFMDVSEAAGLIIQAASYTHGGDIFMLEMGERIRVDDLARKMIRMRGLRPEVDIQIVYTGIRPGEKLHEELVFPEEGREPTDHPLVHRVMSRGVTYQNGRLGIGVKRLLQLAIVGSAESLTNELMVLARSSDGGGDVKDALPARVGAAALSGAGRTDTEGV